MRLEIRITFLAIAVATLGTVNFGNALSQESIATGAVIVPYGDTGYRYLVVVAPTPDTLRNRLMFTDVDDSQWLQGRAPIGSLQLGCALTSATSWSPDSNVIVRKHFSLTSVPEYLWMDYSVSGNNARYATNGYD
jgi:hypothetical protein